ncbi:hypothetical protein SGPA1_11252 [Streptomyces misionensis JCM 4497]
MALAARPAGRRLTGDPGRRRDRGRRHRLANRVAAFADPARLAAHRGRRERGHAAGRRRGAAADRVGAQTGPGPGRHHPRHRHRASEVPGGGGRRAAGTAAPGPVVQRDGGPCRGRAGAAARLRRRRLAPVAQPAVGAAAAHRTAGTRTPGGQRGDRLGPHRGQAPRPGAGRPARPGARRARRGGAVPDRHRRAGAGTAGRLGAGRRGQGCAADRRLPGHHRLGRSDRPVQRAGRGDRQRGEVHPRGRPGRGHRLLRRRHREGRRHRHRTRPHRRGTRARGRPFLAQRPPPERQGLRPRTVHHPRPPRGRRRLDRVRPARAARAAGDGVGAEARGRRRGGRAGGANAQGLTER